MAELVPLSRRELVRKLRRLGFEGPYSGGRHAFMLGREKRAVIPNPHGGDISPAFIREFLKQTDIDAEDWTYA
ncbi:putative periplasmic or secreted lipoprotein [Desulfocurvibacter africanus PCS]|uniref:Putative periplasmic or secreted lipoprotein n=1 Tax=Desulfocurvibacter africanus PCS TaxID=1262666 RepID=M5Q1X7_DESAF|nr:type II toxin-antitoxin system HicA family toxin [Desulfocurvibacter africanus]EMG36943.1 putative periplasmic or secreted lipoprotein [Desulfocurvibacter africanus PCS]